LVPDDITVQLWKARIADHVGAHIFKPDIDSLVLDGIPRNVGQARIMEEIINVKKVFHLACPDRAALVSRLRKRALKDNRFDDASEDVIRRRLQTYEEESKPVLEFLRAEHDQGDRRHPDARESRLRYHHRHRAAGGSVSARQFDEFRASSLFCPPCGKAQPVSQRLLLVLPDRELHEYTCEVCGASVGQREVTAADSIAEKLAQRARQASPFARIVRFGFFSGASCGSSSSVRGTLAPHAEQPH
jgi:hypothetical protein